MFCFRSWSTPHPVASQTCTSCIWRVPNVTGSLQLTTFTRMLMIVKTWVSSTWLKVIWVASVFWNSSSETSNFLGEGWIWLLLWPSPLISLSGVYLYRAKQGVFPPKRFCFPPSNLQQFSYISVFGFAIIFVPCALLFMGSKVLLRWLSVNPNMKLCLSSPRFAREVAYPPPPLSPWASKVPH